jgi:hypothetical protein
VCLNDCDREASKKQRDQVPPRDVVPLEEEEEEEEETCIETPLIFSDDGKYLTSQHAVRKRPT